jgi:hypothetical protein
MKKQLLTTDCKESCETSNMVAKTARGIYMKTDSHKDHCSERDNL